MLASRITTDRLVLEPVSIEIARAVVAGDLATLQPAEGWPHADTADAMKIFLDSDAGPAWFITLGGQVIGDCGTLGLPNQSGAVEIGYGIAAPFRKKGYATEAVGALCGWLLARPDVEVITAGVFVDNQASRRVLDKLGFMPGGEEHEHVNYALMSRGGPAS